MPHDVGCLKKQEIACPDQRVYIESEVQEGDIIFVEKLDAEEGATVEFGEVLAVSGESFVAGTPTVAGAKVTAKVLKNGKGKKIYILKYKSKKNEKKKIGHRQPYTKVQIESIVG